MRKFLAVLLLPSLSLLLVACGEKDINKAEKVDQKELSVQAKACPAGQFDNGMLRCKVALQPVKLSLAVPEGWSAYRFGWDQEDGEVTGHSQSGAASMVQGPDKDGCHLVVGLRSHGLTRKAITKQSVERHNKKGGGIEHFGDQPLVGNTGWFWMETPGYPYPVVFAATPQSDGSYLQWVLDSQGMLFRDGKPQNQGPCTLSISSEQLQDMITGLARGVKIS